MSCVGMLVPSESVVTNTIGSIESNSTELRYGYSCGKLSTY